MACMYTYTYIYIYMHTLTIRKKVHKFEGGGERYMGRVCGEEKEGRNAEFKIKYQ